MTEPVLQSLSFPSDTPGSEVSPFSDEETQCVLCSNKFHPVSEKEIFLTHLLSKHKLVVADVALIADFRRYVEYWKKRFTEHPVTEFCTVIQTNSSLEDRGETELYYLLSDVLPEDKKIREQLQEIRLKYVLNEQLKARVDTSFSRDCLFCRRHFTGNIADLLDHMTCDHNFSVGHPDNIIFGCELLNLIDDKLKRLLCLYCEKTFKDRAVLKEHMRKKQHKILNPDNKEYDRFYMVNYLELGRTWQDIQTEAEDDVEVCGYNSSDEDWSDWEGEDLGAVCLFCDYRSSDTTTLLEHMRDSHNFDMFTLRAKRDLSFYDQIKVINYIRRQMYQKSCPVCQYRKDDLSALLVHMEAENHFDIPDREVWNQPQYYFPTYEDDLLLCGLEDGNSRPYDVNIIPEDSPS